MNICVLTSQQINIEVLFYIKSFQSLVKSSHFFIIASPIQAQCCSFEGCIIVEIYMDYVLKDTL